MWAHRDRPTPIQGADSGTKLGPFWDHSLHKVTFWGLHKVTFWDVKLPSEVKQKKTIELAAYYHFQERFVQRHPEEEA